MLTQATKEQLHALGYSDDDIHHMTPQAAHEILTAAQALHSGNGAAPDPVTGTPKFDHATASSTVDTPLDSTVAPEPDRSKVEDASTGPMLAAALNYAERGWAVFPANISVN